MSRSNLRMAAASCTLAVLGLSATASTEVRAQAPAVNPEAVELLRRTTDYLSSLEQFSVHAWNLREDQLDSGHRVDLEVSGSVTIHRPNKLRGERHDGQIHQILFYDGTTVTLYNSSDQVYSTLPAPETIEKMFEFVNAFVEIYPVSDLIWHNAFPLLMQDVTVAKVVGTEVIGGVTCQHLLFSRPDVDFQIWVPDSGPPLPLKYVVTDTGTPELLSIVTFLSDWEVAPAVPDDHFIFVPPQGAKAIPFPKPDTGSGASR